MNNKKEKSNDIIKEIESKNENDSEQLKEFWLPETKLSWAGKLFFAAVASYLGLAAYKGIDADGSSGEIPKLPIKLRGTKEQLKAIMDVITSSAEFQKEINKPGATVESVIQKLNLKNVNKDNFERIFSRSWPL